MESGEWRIKEEAVLKQWLELDERLALSRDKDDSAKINAEQIFRQLSPTRR